MLVQIGGEWMGSRDQSGLRRRRRLARSGSAESGQRQRRTAAERGSVQWNYIRGRSAELAPLTYNHTSKLFKGEELSERRVYRVLSVK